MDINANYSEEDNPLSLKADFILSLCELVVGGKEGLLPVEKTVIDRCVHLIYRKYFAVQLFGRFRIALVLSVNFCVYCISDRNDLQYRIQLYAAEYLQRQGLQPE